MSQATLFDLPPIPVAARSREFKAHEWKIVSLRECLPPDQLTLADSPAVAANYWQQHVTQHPCFNPDVECFVVLLVNTRRRITGHHLVSTGTIDMLLVHPREVFRAAIIAAAAAVIVMHNHPSGEPTPSDADVKVTRDLIRAGQLMRTEVLDHVIMGRACGMFPTGYSSLKELGYFYS